MSNVKEERKKDAKGGHIRELEQRGSIVKNSDGKPYVFISYSSKDWKKVLYEIVYELCMKKGLRVYFDTKFDEGSDSWLTQFQDNMSDDNCRAVLAFVSPNYKTSYATLMELMSACEDIDSAPTPILPIYIGNEDCRDYGNTGLGTRRFPDNSTNDLWDRELEVFNDLFENLMSKDIIRYKERARRLYSRSKEPIIPYDSDKSEGKIYLNKKNNAELITMILSGINMNNIDGVNKDIVDAVYDKLNAMGYGDVFDKDLVKSDKPTEIDENAYQNQGKTISSSDNHSDAGSAEDTDEKLWNAGAKTVCEPLESSVGLWRYNSKDANVLLEWDGQSKDCIVKKGSKVAREAVNFATSVPAAKDLKEKLKAGGYIVDDCFVKDYECDKISTLMNVLYGGSVSMPNEIRRRKLKKVSESNQVGFTEPELKDDGLIEPSLGGGLGDTPSIGIWRYKTLKGADALLEWDGESKSCIVKKDSKAAQEAAGFGKLLPAKKMKEELKAGGYIVHDRFVKDYECDKISTLINVLCGGSVSMPGEIKTGKLKKVSESDSLSGTENNIPVKIRNTFGSGNGKEGLGSLL